MKKEVKIKYFSEDYPKLKPVFGEKSDWIDLYADERVELKKGIHYLVPLGVAMEIPKGFEAWIVPRSSAFRNWGILQTNSPGIIDNSYCGDDDQWFMSVFAMRDSVINRHERVCQFRLVESQGSVCFVETDVLGNKNRGGHGSTGR